MEEAARIGDLDEIIKIFKENILLWSRTCNPDVMNTAARNGNLKILIWLHEHDWYCTTGAMDAATDYNHFEVIKWLHYMREEGCTRRAMINSAREGNFDIVKFLYECGYQYSNAVIDNAAENGHLDIVKYFYRKGKKCSKHAMDWVARKGHLDVLKFLHERGCECTADAIDWAARELHFDVVKFLVENRDEGCTRASIEIHPSLFLTEEEEKEESLIVEEIVEYLKKRYTRKIRLTDMTNSIDLEIEFLNFKRIHRYQRFSELEYAIVEKLNQERVLNGDKPLNLNERNFLLLGKINGISKPISSFSNELPEDGRVIIILI